MSFAGKSSLFFSALLVSSVMLILTNATLETRTVSQFQTGPFTFSPASGLYNLTSLGFDGIPDGLTLLAFGDFNSDKYTDILAVNDANTTLLIFLWDHTNYIFNNSQNISVDNTILSAIPVDLDYDGLVDLLVITKSSTAANYNFYAYLATRSNTPFNSDTPSQTITYPAQQPTVAYLDDTFQASFIILNADGDRIALSFNSTTADDGTVTLQYVETDFSNYVSTADGCLDYSTVSGATINSPNFNSFIDLNGDCRSDLFIMSTNGGNNYFEIWIRNSSSPNFCLIENTQVTSTVASLGFADVNGDAGIDLVYIQQDSTPTVHVIFNQFYNSAGTACAGSTASSTNLPYLNNNNTDRTNIYDATTNTSATLVYALSGTGAISTDAVLYSYDSLNRPHQLRFGDVNMDGYPDVLVTVTDGTNRQTWILYNNALTSSLRGFSTTVPSGLGTDLNSAIGDSGSYYGTFFDFDEIGTQSLIYVVNKVGYSTLEGYYNNLNQASFFLKALGLDGAQYGSSDFYAGMYFGASFECEVTDVNGNNILRKGAQLSTGSYTPLQLPYAFLGLGKTNNYIENFVYGYDISGTNTHKWSPIIPNSQLIITPTISGASSWKIDVFVKPTSNTLIVVITTVAILLILGMVICYLHYKEKEEDKQHQEKYLHLLG